MERNKQVEAAEEAEAASIKAMHDSATYMTTAEREKAERLKLYAILKAYDNLDMYYYLYPDERPKKQASEPERTDESRGRGR